MEFESFQVGPIGDLIRAGGEPFAWVTVGITLPQDGTGAYPDIEIKVPIQYGRDWSVDRIQQAAFAKAKKSIEQALGLFAQHGLEGLQRQNDEREAAEATQVGEFRLDLPAS